jgi:drug/metabolite transporter superfamily protein YnfA
VHLFNFPDAVSGGGLLNAVFLIPPVCAVAGCWYVARGNRRRARQALMLLGASLSVLLAAALLAASASFPGDA